jgi:hypothetical protein
MPNVTGTCRTGCQLPVASCRYASHRVRIKAKCESLMRRNCRASSKSSRCSQPEFCVLSTQPKTPVKSEPKIYSPQTGDRQLATSYYSTQKLRSSQTLKYTPGNRQLATGNWELGTGKESQQPSNDHSCIRVRSPKNKDSKVPVCYTPALPSSQTATPSRPLRSRLHELPRYPTPWSEHNAGRHQRCLRRGA